MQGEYNTLKVTAAQGGWFVSERGQIDVVFVNWNNLINYLADRLSSK